MSVDVFVVLKSVLPSLSIYAFRQYDGIKVPSINADNCRGNTVRAARSHTLVQSRALSSRSVRAGAEGNTVTHMETEEGSQTVLSLIETQLKRFEGSSL